MKNSFVFAALVSLIFSFSNAYSQGVFLEKGEIGFFGSGSYLSLENGSATSFGAGLALGGFFEVGISRSNSKVEIANYYYSSNLNLKSTSISLGIVLLNRKAILEVNLGYSSTDNSDIDVLLLGFSVADKIPLHEKISWNPTLAFALGFPQGGNDDNPITAISLSAPIIIEKIVYLGPSLGFSDGDFSWGITGGIMVRFNSDIAGGW